MPCLGLGKGLFLSIKTWKSFTIKMLQKLHPCKIIKISKTRRAKATRSRAPPPMYYPSLPSRKNGRRRTAKDRYQLFGASKAVHRPRHQHRFKKQSLQAPPPVFIDELFWTHPEEVEEGLPGSSVKGKPGLVTSSAVEVPRNASSSDEVWESVPVVPPQLRGIDARAEEFITRFRAQLEFQEIVAHHL